MLIGAAAFIFRYLTSGAIENDHFIMLARAHQVLYGDWPVRDFEDPGQPLAYLVSTAAAAAFGPTLLVNYRALHSVSVRDSSDHVPAGPPGDGQHACGDCRRRRHDRHLSTDVQHHEGDRAGRRDLARMAVRRRARHAAAGGARGVDGGRVSSPARLRRVRRDLEFGPVDRSSRRRTA